jgi:hypothetical protein
MKKYSLSDVLEFWAAFALFGFLMNYYQAPIYISIAIGLIVALLCSIADNLKTIVNKIDT